MKDKQYRNMTEVKEDAVRAAMIEQKGLDTGLRGEIRSMISKCKTFLEDLDRFEQRYPEVLESNDVSDVHRTVNILDSYFLRYLEQ